MSETDAVDLEGLSLTELDVLRQKLMGGRNDFDELSEAEIERWIAINNRIRQAGRVAAKPAGNGGTAGRKRAAAKEPQRSLDDLMGEFE